jgi:hypothetical protein
MSFADTKYISVNCHRGLSLGMCTRMLIVFFMYGVQTTVAMTGPSMLTGPVTCVKSFPVVVRKIHEETVLDCVWNVMAHAQKQDFVFQRNGRVHLNRRGVGGRQFSRVLAAELYASAVVMLDTPFSEVTWSVLATHSIRQFPLHFSLPCVTVCHHISTGLYNQTSDERKNKPSKENYVCTQRWGWSRIFLPGFLATLDFCFFK